jgi:predicted lipoprotein with Yx(FWY)xxD motif
MRARRSRLLGVGAAAAAVALGAAACGGSTNPTGGGTASSPPGSPAAATGSASLVRTESTPFGTVLANASGRTLYLLTADRPGHSACTGSCLAVWPPVLVTGALPHDTAGIHATFGTLHTSAGRQLTVNGYPAHTYVGDSGPGQTVGEGIKSFGGTWWALSASGAPIKHRRTGSSSSTSSGGGGGYGY